MMKILRNFWRRVAAVSLAVVFLVLFAGCQASPSSTQSDGGKVEDRGSDRDLGVLTR